MEVNGIEVQCLAPVLIPTLCRADKLKNLLESLAKCELASQTEVYIALDFPKSQNHVEGYNKICQYLEKIDNLNFKKIHVIKRETNFGFGKNGNIRSLLRDILVKYDRYILTEDDNVFAPGFLTFMNYNLERYKNDKSILAVCGYMYPLSIPYQNKVLQLEQFSAWGYGTWKDRRLFIEGIQDNQGSLDNMIGDGIFRKKCQKNRLSILTDMIGMAKGEPILGDSIISAIQIFYGKKSIFPSKSLVRNCGWDGSGTHGGVRENYLAQEIDEKAQIKDFTDANQEENQISDRIIYSFHDTTTAWIQHLLNHVTYSWYKLTGEYISFKSLRKVWKKMRNRIRV